MKNKILKSQIYLIILSACLMGIAQQPINLGFIAWIGLVPFIYVISKNELKNTIIYSFTWGFLYNLIVVFWLSQNIGTSKIAAFISMILAVLILSLNTVAISYIWFRIKKNNQYSIFLIPFIWVSIEFIRSFGILGFPWIYLIQNAEYVGIYGISFWIVLINSFLYWILFHNRKLNLYLSLCAVFVFPWLLGIYHLSQVNETSIDDYKVSIIQPNIGLSNKNAELEFSILSVSLIISFLTAKFKVSFIGFKL